MNTKELLEKKLDEYTTSVDELIDEKIIDTLWTNRHIYIYLYGKVINQQEMEHLKQVLTQLNFKHKEKYISNKIIIQEIIDLKRQNKTIEETTKAIKELNRKVGENL